VPVEIDEQRRECHHLRQAATPVARQSWSAQPDSHVSTPAKLLGGQQSPESIVEDVGLVKRDMA